MIRWGAGLLFLMTAVMVLTFGSAPANAAIVPSGGPNVVFASADSDGQRVWVVFDQPLNTAGYVNASKMTITAGTRSMTPTGGRYWDERTIELTLSESIAFDMPVTLAIAMNAVESAAHAWNAPVTTFPVQASASVRTLRESMRSTGGTIRIGEAVKAAAVTQAAGRDVTGDGVFDRYDAALLLLQIDDALAPKAPLSIVPKAGTSLADYKLGVSERYLGDQKFIVRLPKNNGDTSDYKSGDTVAVYSGNSSYNPEYMLTTADITALNVPGGPGYYDIEIDASNYYTYTENHTTYVSALVEDGAGRESVKTWTSQPVITDYTNPELILVSPIGSVIGGTSISVQTSKAATVFLVPAGTAATEEAIRAASARSTTTTGANVDLLSTSGVASGDYQVVALDTVGNVSTPSPTITLYAETGTGTDIVANVNASSTVSGLFAVLESAGSPLDKTIYNHLNENDKLAVAGQLLSYRPMEGYTGLGSFQEQLNELATRWYLMPTLQKYFHSILIHPDTTVGTDVQLIQLYPETAPISGVSIAVNGVYDLVGSDPYLYPNEITAPSQYFHWNEGDMHVSLASRSLGKEIYGLAELTVTDLEHQWSIRDRIHLTLSPVYDLRATNYASGADTIVANIPGGVSVSVYDQPSGGISMGTAANTSTNERSVISISIPGGFLEQPIVYAQISDPNQTVDSRIAVAVPAIPAAPHAEQVIPPLATAGTVQLTNVPDHTSIFVRSASSYGYESLIGNDYTVLGGNLTVSISPIPEYAAYVYVSFGVNGGESEIIPVPVIRDEVTAKLITASTIGQLSGNWLLHVPAATKVADLLQAVTIRGQSKRLLQYNGGPEVEDGNTTVEPWMLIRVTAQDGSAAYYYIDTEDSYTYFEKSKLKSVLALPETVMTGTPVDLAGLAQTTPFSADITAAITGVYSMNGGPSEYLQLNDGSVTLTAHPATIGSQQEWAKITLTKNGLTATESVYVSIPGLYGGMLLWNQAIGADTLYVFGSLTEDASIQVYDSPTGATPLPAEQLSAGHVVVFLNGLPAGTPALYVAITQNGVAGQRAKVIVPTNPAAPKESDISIVYDDSIHAHIVHVGPVPNLAIVRLYSSPNDSYTYSTEIMAPGSGIAVVTDGFPTDSNIVYVAIEVSGGESLRVPKFIPGRSTIMLEPYAAFAVPDYGSASGTTRIGELFLPEGAFAWQIKVSSEPFVTPELGSVYAGSSYQADEDIPLSPGDHIGLAAVTADGRVVGFADIPVASGQIKGEGVISGEV